MSLSEELVEEMEWAAAYYDHYRAMLLLQHRAYQKIDDREIFIGYQNVELTDFIVHRILDLKKENATEEEYTEFEELYVRHYGLVLERGDPKFPYLAYSFLEANIDGVNLVYGVNFKGAEKLKLRAENCLSNLEEVRLQHYNKFTQYEDVWKSMSNCMNKIYKIKSCTSRTSEIEPFYYMIGKLGKACMRPKYGLCHETESKEAIQKFDYAAQKLIRFFDFFSRYLDDQTVRSDEFGSFHEHILFGIRHFKKIINLVPYTLGHPASDAIWYFDFLGQSYELIPWRI